MAAAGLLPPPLLEATLITAPADGVGPAVLLSIRGLKGRPAQVGGAWPWTCLERGLGGNGTPHGCWRSSCCRCMHLIGSIAARNSQWGQRPTRVAADIVAATR